MIDLHSHLLPAIDDGPETLDEAVQMCRLAAADGCRTLVATPHLRHGRWPQHSHVYLQQTVDRLQDRVGQEPEIKLGGEIRIDSTLLEDLESPGAATCIPLAESRYLLLEFSRDGVGPDPEAIIHEVQLLGWRPILAHPEFIPMLAGDLALMRRLVDMGALFQITAMSVTGAFGRRIRRSTMNLVDSGLVHFVASDAHGESGRPPGLSRARDLISRQWGEGSARRLTEDNPLAVMENREITVSSAVLL